MMNEQNSQKSYECARDELITVVERLERGGLNLETALALWEQGDQLVQYCRSKLHDASIRIEKVLATKETSGNTQTTAGTKTISDTQGILIDNTDVIFIAEP